MVAAFAAVNESTWEHMKLLAMPWVIWSLVEAVALRSSRQSVLMARALGLLAGLVTIRVLAKNKLTGPIWGAVGLLLLLGVAALFVWWTYAPPVLPIFIDPTNGTVGLPAIGM